MSRTKRELETAKPARRQKHISAADLKQIAFLVECRRMNYKEATAFLGIDYQVWRNWLERAGNAPKWDYLVARVKSAYLEGRLKNIQDAEVGRNGHRPDWRASRALLEIADSRYTTPQPAPATPPTGLPSPVINLWIEAARLNCEPAAQALDVPEVKQIADAKPAEPGPEPASSRPPERKAELPARWRKKPMSTPGSA
jgi:hypothetical protein